MGFPLLPEVIDKELVLEFFWRFSVFECALKRGKYLRKKSDGDPAEADWEDFGNFAKGKFQMIRNPDFAEGVARLRRLSPRKQVVQKQELDWKPQKQGVGESDEAYTIRLLTTVRNNLFHGGKYPDGGEFEVAKDREILRAALAVLGGLYELCPVIKFTIDEAAA